MQLILGLPNSQFYTVVITIMLSTCTSLLAAALVSSRFIFALARDYALPFSNLFYRTDKQRTPWVAELLVVSAMYISVVGWYIPERYYDNLLQTFWLWFMTLTYVSRIRAVGRKGLTPRSSPSASTSSPAWILRGLTGRSSRSSAGASHQRRSPSFG
jgi:amino acid transporter